MGLALTLFQAGLTGVLYLALEPYVRRRWPQVLIGWTRILDGRWRDSLVGTHVLAGMVLGVTSVLASRGLFLLGREFGGAPGLDNLSGLLGVRFFTGSLISDSLNALTGAVQMLFLLFLLRVVLRRDWLAALVFVLLNAGNIDTAGAPILAAAVAVINIGTILVALQRYGLLTAFVTMAVFMTIVNSAATLNASHWYFGYSLVVLLLLASVATYAFRMSLGEQSLLGDEALG